MFKKPIAVEIEAQNVTVTHTFEVDITTLVRAKQLVAQVGTTAIGVIAVAAIAKTASDIVTHVVKTQIK